MGLSISVDEIQDRVEKVLSRADNARAWLTRVAYKRYQNAQMERWMTKGASQGTPWRDNPSGYKEYKQRKFVNAPGQGRFVMIQTGQLVASVVGPTGSQMINNSEGIAKHRRIISAKALEVFTTVDYAEEAGSQRPFMNFKKSFYDDLIKEYRDWLLNGDT